MSCHFLIQDDSYSGYERLNEMTTAGHRIDIVQIIPSLSLSLNDCCFLRIISSLPLFNRVSCHFLVQEHFYSGYESSTGRKEDGSRTAVQMIIPGLEIPRWLTYQSLGNSVNIELPPNSCSSKWMGLALCASFNAISSPSYAHEFGNPVKTFGLRAHVEVRDVYLHPPFEIFFNVKFAPNHIWLLYLSRDDWFATFNPKWIKIGVVFETYSVNVWKCGAGLLYEQDMEEFHKTFAQCGGSSITTYEGWDGVHYEFENSLDPLL